MHRVIWLASLPQLFAFSGDGGRALVAPKSEFSKISCFFSGVTFDACCSLTASAVVRHRCWSSHLFTFSLCCQLVPWFDHDKSLPLPSHPVIPVRLVSIGLDSGRMEDVLCIYQGAQDSEKYGRGHPSAVMSRATYQLFRWFECFADQQSRWDGLRYVEFGAGLGALGVMAALNGAYVMLVLHHDEPSWPIEMNVAHNLPITLWHRVKICKLKWKDSSLRQSLKTLARCEGSTSELPQAYDIVVHAMSLATSSAPLLDRSLLKLLRAATACGGRVILHCFCTETVYAHVLEPIVDGYLVRTGLWYDEAMTAHGGPPLMEFEALGACPADQQNSRALRRGLACVNTTRIPFKKRIHTPWNCDYTALELEVKQVPLDIPSKERDIVKPMLEAVWTSPNVSEPVRRPSVATCITGLERTLLSFPVVSTYREHVLKPLEWNGYNVDTFMSIVDSNNHTDLSSKITQVYHPKRLTIHQDDVYWVPIPPHCRPNDFGRSNDRVLLQFHAIRHCYRQVESVEQKRGVAYTWVYRLRSDTVYFNDLVPEAGLTHDFVYVPLGGMMIGTTKCMNDQLFVCPRALCRPYFNLLEIWESPHCTLSPGGELCPVGSTWANFTGDDETPVVWPVDGISVPNGLTGPPDADFVLPAVPQRICYNTEDPRTDPRLEHRDVPDSHGRGWHNVKLSRKVDAQWYFFARYGGSAPCSNGQSTEDCCGRIREVEWSYVIARTGGKMACKSWLHDLWPLGQRSRTLLSRCRETLRSWRAREFSGEVDS
eukprot:TRINITY_DN16939_c0_g1_i1.p1 TRINITY_DN16939_c0_g1~~TRINITY_DN16939_c0_g1_i1.p1  ORF type:complete len:768 (+),score=46.55 TRINITY_DN16939_c0_g1_i1:28-2331(+)